MQIGTSILAWRRQKGLTQEQLALKTGLPRPYISRLEQGGIDPTLSSLQRLAMGLNIEITQLIAEFPPSEPMTRDEIDDVARAAIEPGSKNAQRLPQARVLSRFIKERRRAIGLYRPRKSSITAGSQEGVHAARWLRASLGESQWKAILSRIDKLASHHAEQA